MVRREEDYHMPDLQALGDALRLAYHDWGYPIILLSALLENTALLGFVLPGGSMLLLGAVYAQQGILSLPLVVLCGWVGMVLGTSLDYALGRWGLQELLRRSRLRGRLDPKLGEAERFLERHGAGALLLAHFVGHLRSFVAMTAGASRLPYRRFLRYECLAALVWNAIWTLLGYLVGENMGLVQRYMAGAGIVMVLMALAAYLVYRLYGRRRRTLAD
jgi:membrane protein DedA with SNARE-associated domain